MMLHTPVRAQLVLNSELGSQRYQVDLGWADFRIILDARVTITS